jgi:hypothetical protein
VPLETGRQTGYRKTWKAVQSLPASPARARAPEPKRTARSLPRSAHTHIVLNDIDLAWLPGSPTVITRTRAVRPSCSPVYPTHTFLAARGGWSRFSRRHILSRYRFDTSSYPLLAWLFP